MPLGLLEKHVYPVGTRFVAAKGRLLDGLEDQAGHLPRGAVHARPAMSRHHTTARVRISATSRKASPRKKSSRQ